MAIHHQLDKTLLTSHASHNAANVLRNFEQMCDGQGVQQLVLRQMEDRDKRENGHYTHTRVIQQP